MLYINPMTASPAITLDGTVDAKKEKIALEELEHMFLWTLMREMRKSVPEDTLLGGGYEREMFDDMLNDSLSAEMARSGQIGIAKQIAEQLNAPRLQEERVKKAQAEAMEQLNGLDAYAIQASLNSADNH